MNLLPIRVSHQVCVGIFATFVVGLYFSDYPRSFKSMAAEQQNPISGLKVAIAYQTGSSPPTILATVTNENQTPISILSYNSPLDPLALQIGLLTITPSGAGEPLQFPRLEVARTWPPMLQDIITIAPGETVRNSIELKPQVVPPETLPQKATYELKGEWRAVWAKSKENINEAELEGLTTDKNVFSGKFSSGSVEFEI